MSPVLSAVRGGRGRLGPRGEIGVQGSGFKGVVRISLDRRIETDLIQVPRRAPATRFAGFRRFDFPSSDRGHSSVGRAREWHSRGRRFDPAWLHQISQQLSLI